MKEMSFSVEIQASKEKVWDALWRDENLRQWAGIIDSGTCMTGELVEGGEIQFISAENGYGVTSLVEKVTPNEFVQLRHQADTQDAGASGRETEWTGGVEIYSLAEKDGRTILTVTFDVPDKMETYFRETYPKAMDMIKSLSEAV